MYALSTCLFTKITTDDVIWKTLQTNAKIDWCVEWVHLFINLELTIIREPHEHKPTTTLVSYVVSYLMIS